MNKDKKHKRTHKEPTGEIKLGDEYVQASSIGAEEWARRKKIVRDSGDKELAISLGFCGRPTRGAGRCCMRRAGQATDHVGHGPCKYHGGAFPNATKSAQMTQAKRAVHVLGLPREISPQQALLERVHSLAGIVDWIEKLLRGMDSEADLVWGIVEKTEAGDSSVVKMQERPSVWLRLHQEYSKHLVDTCAIAIKCGLAERQVKIAEKEGRLMARVIEAVLVKLGVDVFDHDVRQMVGQSIRELGPAIDVTDINKVTH